MYRKYFKRPLDFILSLCALIALSPFLFIVGILVRVNLGSPIIFQQKRPGLKENIFTLYKFRTMTDERDENGELLADEIRLTEFGKFLRSTSIDELPELWNIVLGDMSICGPRPLLIKDMVFMMPDQRKRHSVRPGLTGWAQVNGRNDVTWEEKLTLDLKYIENLTFFHDIRIILLTVTKVFVSEGINTQGFGTAEDLGDYLLRENRITANEYAVCIDEYNSIIRNNDKLIRLNI